MSESLAELQTIVASKVTSEVVSEKFKNAQKEYWNKKLLTDDKVQEQLNCLKELIKNKAALDEFKAVQFRLEEQSVFLEGLKKYQTDEMGNSWPIDSVVAGMVSDLAKCKEIEQESREWIQMS